MLHRHMPTTPETFRKAMASDRQDLVVAVACLLTWDLACRPVRSGRDSVCAGTRPIYEGDPGVLSTSNRKPPLSFVSPATNTRASVNSTLHRIYRI